MLCLCARERQVLSGDECKFQCPAMPFRAFPLLPLPPYTSYYILVVSGQQPGRGKGLEISCTLMGHSSAALLPLGSRLGADESYERWIFIARPSATLRMILKGLRDVGKARKVPPQLYPTRGQW